MKHKYNLEILTPVHIGTGEKIGSVEYVLDKGLHRIDMNELFKDSTFKVQTFINFSENRNCYLGEFNKELALKYTLYYVAIDSKIESELLNQIKNNRSADINEFKKNVFNQPYIPGSSMKGAIRTAILWYILKNDSNKLQDVINIRQKMIKQNPKNPKKADNKILESIFGKDPNYDFLRVLQVSDTAPISINELEVSETKVLTTTQNNNYGWKKLPRYTKKDPQMATSIFVESLRKTENAISSLTIKIDDFLLEDDIARKLGFNGKQNFIKSISEICNSKSISEICNSYAKEFINNEIDFFNKYHLPNLVNAYDDLLDKIPSNNNAFLLHLGWGSGWHGMTITEILGNTILNDIRWKFNIGKKVKYHKKCNGIVKPDKYNKNKFYCNKCRKGKLTKKDIGTKLFYPFPKTRKIVFKNGNPEYPLGWIKLTG